MKKFIALICLFAFVLATSVSYSSSPPDFGKAKTEMCFEKATVSHATVYQIAPKADNTNYFIDMEKEKEVINVSIAAELNGVLEVHRNYIGHNSEQLCYTSLNTSAYNSTFSILNSTFIEQHYSKIVLHGSRCHRNC